MLKPAIAPYPQRRRDRVQWFWIDAVIFWLACTAVNHVLMISIYDYRNLPAVLITTGAALLLSIGVCYNKYTVIAGVLTPLALLTGLFWMMGQSLALREFIYYFVPWVWDNMPYVQADTASPYFFPCAMAMIAFITLLSYIFAFQLRAVFGYLVAGGAATFIFWQTYDTYYIGHTVNRNSLLYCMSAVLCCVLYFLVRRQYQRTTGKLSFARSFVPFQKFFLPILLIAGVGTAAIAPVALDGVYSQAWVNAVDWTLTHGVPDGYIDAEWMSFYRDRSELGGDIEMASDPLFTVMSSAPLHLRSVVYDTYDGRRWSDTLSEKMETIAETEPMYAHGHSNSTKPIYQQFFALNEPFIAFNYDFNGAYNPLYPVVARNYTIKDNKLFTRSVLSTTYTKRATFIKSSGQVLVNGSSALLSNRRMTKEDSYTVSYLEPVGKSFTDYIGMSGGEALNEAYSSLPENLPSRVRELADQLAGDSQTPYDICRSISNYLTVNQTYTITPGDVPKGRDFVDYFLFENKNGYCVYYATAMVVLARAVGIPARYVEGYRLDDYDPGRGRVVTGQNAHAWAEVYFDGVGWITFDPVAANQFASNRGVRIPNDSNSTASGPVESTASAPSQQAGPVEPPRQEPSSAPLPAAGNISAGLLAGLIVLLLVLAACAAFVITKYSVYRGRYRRRFDQCPDDQILSRYRELERALRRCGFTREDGQTVRTFLTSLSKDFSYLEQAAAGRRKPAETRDFDDITFQAARAVYTAAYSNAPPSEEDKQALITLTRIAEQRVRKQMTSFFFVLWWKPL